MKTTINRLSLTVLTAILAVSTVSQNRVPNGSFEMLTSCPTDQSQVHLAPPWYRTYVIGGFTGGFTPDLLARCHVNWTLINGQPIAHWVSVPVNQWGTQEPRTGDNYFGAIFHFSSIFMSGTFSYEYFSVPVIPLDSGRVYQLRFFVNLADGFSSPDYAPNPNVYGRNSTVAIEQIGAALTDTNLLVVAPQPVPWYYYNQYYNVPTTAEHSGSVLDDTLNWTEISAVFTATGHESYLTLGTFHHPWQVNYTVRWLDSTNIVYVAYYYFDDVSICPVDTVLPPGDAGHDTLICQGDSVLLGTPGYPNWYYRWHPGAGTRDSLSPQTWVLPWHTSSYILEATDPCFTKTWDTVTVRVQECGPQAGSDTSVCLENPVILGDSINLAYHCLWVPSTFLNSDTLPMPTCIPYIAGSITYVMTASDNFGNPVRTDTVTMNGVDCTGFDDIESKGDVFQVNTDPEGEQILISFNGELWPKAVFHLYDMNGRKLLQSDIDPGGTTHISSSGLRHGLYLYSIRYDSHTIQNGKLVIY